LIKRKEGEVLNSIKHFRSFWSGFEKLIDYVISFLISYGAYWIVRILYPVSFRVSTVRALFIIAVFCLIASFLYNYYNVYLPMRTRKPLFFISRIFLVNMEMALLLLAIVWIMHEAKPDPYIVWILVSVGVACFILMSKKIAMISFLHNLRARQRNIKHVLLVTDSQEMADAYMEEILDNPQFGYSVIGYVGNLNVIGLPHLGATGELDRVLKEYRDMGFYSIKHTDGNIMPILEQMVQCGPDALHSLDPQGGVSLKEVKKLCGDRVALCGNVNCGLLQTGTDEQVIADVRRALSEGMDGYGYIFCTSNCAYTGLPLERYELIHKIWREEGIYR
jgi:hypothetical protein